MDHGRTPSFPPSHRQSDVPSTKKWRPSNINRLHYVHMIYMSLQDARTALELSFGASPLDLELLQMLQDELSSSDVKRNWTKASLPFTCEESYGLT